MKRLFIASMFLLLFTSSKAACAGILTDDFYRQSGYSNEYDFWGAAAGGSNGTTINDRMTTALGKWGFSGSLNDRLQQWSGRISRNPSLSVHDNLDRVSSLYKGLMFYKSYQDNGSTSVPEFSGGSTTATFTASRDSTHPATYFDANGVMQVTTTSNAIRNTKGYYDATGWHAAPGLLLEGQSTNMIIRTDGTASGSGLWTGWSIGGGTANTPTASQADVSALSGITGAYAQRLQYVNGADTNKACQIESTNTGAASVAAGNVLTLSFWARSQTGITGCNFDGQIIWRNSSASFLSASNVTPTLTTSWRRYFITATAPASTDRINVKIGPSSGVDSGDTVDFEIYGVQVEIAAYPSSFIPTTTAALTRNAESLSYASAGNFPAPSGGNCLSFDGQNASGDDYVSIANSATGNQISGITTGYSVEQWVFVRSDGEADAGRMWNKDPSYSRTVSQSGSTVAIHLKWDFGAGTDAECQTAAGSPVSTNSWHHIVSSLDSSNVPHIFVDGAEVIYGSQITGVGTVFDDSGNSFYVGNEAGTSQTFDGFIQCTRIYRNKALSAGEVATAYAAGRYASQPVAGCTAEYLFNEGAGTTLTDGVAGNNGTISGAAWSKDTHAGTILMKYRPVMMPNEQGASYKRIFQIITGIDRIALEYDNNANNGYWLMTTSNNNQNRTISQSASSWIRYASKVIAISFSDQPGTKLNLYENGISQKTSAYFAIVAGSFQSKWGVQPSSGQAMILESIGIWNRALTAAEVAAVYADQSR